MVSPAESKRGMGERNKKISRGGQVIFTDGQGSEDVMGEMWDKN